MSSRISSARSLRRRATDSERLLWQRLRGRQIGGKKFRRQVPIGPYIVDFLSHDARIVIEIDGSQHQEQAHKRRDAARDRWLQAKGFEVLRFWSSDVLAVPEAVLSAIVDAIEHRPLVPPSPSPSLTE